MQTISRLSSFHASYSGNSDRQWTVIQDLIHFSFGRRLSFSFYLVSYRKFYFYLVSVFLKDLVLILVSV